LDRVWGIGEKVAGFRPIIRAVQVDHWKKGETAVVEWYLAVDAGFKLNLFGPNGLLKVWNIYMPSMKKMVKSSSYKWTNMMTSLSWGRWSNE